MQFLFHKKFQLNGTSFNGIEELLVFSKIISSDIFSFLSDFLSDDEKISVRTSGSTGTPKVIEIKKEFMINSAIATGKFFDLQEDTTALLCMNPTYIAGKMMLVRAMVLGWKLDVVSPSSNPLEGVEKKYDFSAMVPMQVHHSLDDLHKIKKLIIGGGALSKELENKLQTVKAQCFVTYGMTETVTHIAVKSVNNYELRIANDELGITNYTALPNVKFSQGKRGCLVIDAPKVSENNVITNDLVELISDTEFKWLGRFDNIINSGGIKLIPEQIEKKLAKIIEQRFFVAGVKDAVLGEKLVLVVEIKRDKDTKEQRRKVEKFESLKVEKLKGSKEQRNKVTKLKNVILSNVQHLKTLSKYEMPKEIYFVEKFIETDTKKIQRKKTLDLVLF